MESIDYSFEQLLSHFGYEMIEKTAFMEIHKKEQSRYVLFSDADNNKIMSLLDLQKFKVISKKEFILEHSNYIMLDKSLDAIYTKNVQVVKINEVITKDNLIDYIFYYAIVKDDNEHIIGLRDENTIKLDSQVFEIRNGKLAMPLFLNNGLVNSLEFDRDGFELLVDNFGINLIKQNETNQITATFQPMNIYYLNSGEHTAKENLLVIGEGFDYLKYCRVIQELEDSFQAPEIRFLVNQENIKEQELFLEYVLMAGMYRGSNIEYKNYKNCFVLQIGVAKGDKILKVVQFFAELNNAALDCLGIEKDNYEEKAKHSLYLFQVEKAQKGEDKIVVITSQKKVELLHVLSKRMIEYLELPIQIVDMAEITNDYAGMNDFYLPETLF